MAKRRKVVAPSAQELTEIEEGFRRETSETRATVGALAPISQVSADAAQSQELGAPEVRAQMAKDTKDAQELRKAEDAGRLILELPLDQVDPNAMVRDRTVLNKEEFDELKWSIYRVGQRLPIEVFLRSNPKAGEAPYGLISGYRRYRAVEALHAEDPDEKYETVLALVRNPEDLGGAIVAMVEENEIRETVSHYERGRIAVIAAQDGVFASTELAVDALFRSASKAKRSKIRSFALIFEDLGDCLRYPELLKEREGLRLAAALRSGAEVELRQALLSVDVTDPAQEWPMLEPILSRYETKEREPARGGRPRRVDAQAGWEGDTLHLESGIKIRRETDAREGHVIRVMGDSVAPEMVEFCMEELAKAINSYRRGSD